MSLQTFLTDIANTIRAKRGTTAPIKARNFAAAITNLPKDSNINALQKYLEVNDGSADYLFYYSTATNLDDVINGVDFSSVNTMYGMFYLCKALTNVPLFNTSNVTNMQQMFSDCEKLTSVPLFDTSNVTDMAYMFSGCKSLTTVPLFDTSNVTNMKAMFSSCQNLTTVPLLDTSNITSMYYMFHRCISLTSIPLFDTRNVTDMSYAFYECSALTSVPALDMRSVTDPNKGQSMFFKCVSLTDCFIKNIKINLTIGSVITYGVSYGTSYGHLLTMDSLLNLLNETVYYGNRSTLTLGSANLAKFTGDYEYVKKTGKILDLDDNEVTELISGQTKIPVVWCSSTDEGAMTVAEYMDEKGWYIE